MSSGFLPDISGKSPHKNTLFHTVAHFRGCFICGQVIFRSKKAIFINEVNDLAHFVEAMLLTNLQEKEALIADTEGDVSALHMYLSEVWKFEPRKIYAVREAGCGAGASVPWPQREFALVAREVKEGTIRPASSRRRSRSADLHAAKGAHDGYVGLEYFHLSPLVRRLAFQ